MERCVHDAGVPSRCQQSNIVSVVINGWGARDGTDKMLFHHQGHYLIFDNVCGELLYPAVKTGAWMPGREDYRHRGRIVNLSNQCDFTQ